MSTVRTVVQPGWIAVGGPEVSAVVAAGDRHAQALETAAADGLLAVLEALTTHGMAAAPDFAAAAPTATGVRVVLRGAGVAVLPDGTRLDARGRLPWLDFDLDADQGAEVVLEAPEPQQPRGWQRPARLSRRDGPAAVPQPELTLPPPADLTGLPPAARVPVTPPPRGGLIDAVPWRRPGGTKELPPADPTETFEPVDEPAVPAPTPTELLPVVPETAADPEPAASDPAVPDVTTDRGALPRADEDLDRPVVLAVLCPAGHPSPPHAGSCRTCGREIPPQQPFPTPRPSLGVLRISTGGSVPLDRGVLLGRAPRVNEELPANQRPHLLRVGGADRDISRNHAEVVLEGWHVLVRDLGSTNGTTVTLPGQEPVRLRPTEDQGIEPGTVVTLADEVVLTYEVQE